jgi:hypothetical protein
MAAITKSDAAIRQELERLQREDAQLNARRERIAIEREVLRNLLRLIEPTALDAGETKIGPADAVRKILRDAGGQAPRRVVLERAVSIVSTAPEKARKTVDQTIRNLINLKGEIRNEDGILILQDTNGHR